MHSDIDRGLAMLQAAGQFGTNHPELLVNARAAALFSEVRSAADDIRQMDGTQEFNRTTFRATASERQQVATAMRHLMGKVARVAKVLDRAEYPDARFKLRVPRSNGYFPLLTQARVYLKTLPAMKQEFVDRGM